MYLLTQLFYCSCSCFRYQKPGTTSTWGTCEFELTVMLARRALCGIRSAALAVPGGFFICLARGGGIGPRTP